jgi:hypothetical protein
MDCAFVLVDGLRVVPPATICAWWLAEMFPGDAPPDRWLAVPRRLMPDSAEVAYFNGHQFFAAHFAPQPPAPQPPTQPLTPFAGRGRRLGE